MRKILFTLIILGIVSCKSISKTKKKSEMELTPQISEVLNHLQKIEVFQGKNPLDISRKNYETMAQQIAVKKRK